MSSLIDYSRSARSNREPSNQSASDLSDSGTRPSPPQKSPSRKASQLSNGDASHSPSQTNGTGSGIFGGGNPISALLGGGSGGGDDARKRTLSSKSRASSTGTRRGASGRDDGYSGKRQGSRIQVAGTAAGESRDTSSVDRHYLNKAVLSLESQREWSALSVIGELAEYGHPFLPHPTGPKSGPKSEGGFLGFGGKKVVPQAGDWERPISPPILSYLYYRFVYNFPCLREAKLDFWQTNIQPFFDSFAERNLSCTQERSEVTKRRLLAMGFTRLIGTYYGTCVTAAGETTPSRPDVGLMKKIDLLVPGTMHTMYQVMHGTKGDTKTEGYNTWVAVPEFRKDGYVVISRLLEKRGQPFFFAQHAYEDFENLADDLEDLNEDDLLRLPLLPPLKPSGGAPEPRSIQKYLRHIVISLCNPSKTASDAADLKRARERLEKFLLSSNLKIAQKDGDALLDKAEDDDKKAEEDRANWVKAGARVNRLRSTWNMYKDALISSDELERSFATLKQIGKISQLPQVYQDAEEWALYWVSNALYFIFVAGPNAKEISHLIHSIHKLLPYGLMKQGLSLANPTIAIKVVVNLVLGQPMGANSLFQRIFSIVMGSDIRARRKDISEIRKKLNEDDYCDAIEDFVYSEREKQEGTREESYKAGEDILLTIFKRHGCSGEQVRQAQKWADAYIDAGLSHVLVAEDTAHGLREDSPAIKYLELKKLLRNVSLKRDREQVLEIVMEPNTPRLLKSMIAVFYSAINKIANATNLAARLGDLQAFLDDMLTLVTEGTPTAAEYLACCRRHQQSLYFFLHEMHAQGGTMTQPIIEWSRSGLNFIRQGIPSEPSNKRSGRLGIDYDSMLNEVDRDTRAEILSEVRGIAIFIKWAKMHRDVAMRCIAVNEDSPNSQLDVNELYAELKSADRELQVHLEHLRQRDDHGDREEDTVPWAWWAEDDIVNNPNEIKVDWKATAAAKEAKNKKANKKKKKGQEAEERVKKTENWDGSIPAAPRLRATKNLLELYTNRVSKTLDGAKKAEIK